MAGETIGGEESLPTTTSSTKTSNGNNEPLQTNEEESIGDSPTLKIKRWLVKLMLGSNSSGDTSHGTKNNLNYRKRLVAVSLLTVVIAGLIRLARRRRRISVSSSSSTAILPIWPLGLLLEWWRGPEYNRSPNESTMSLLWAAAKDGIVQQALIGSSTIYFQTKRSIGGNNNNGANNDTKTQWNRAILPTNNDAIRNGLLEALAQGGAQVSAIPESIWSKLATPILAALPFIYLALLYRMMKNQFGGEDISSKVTNGTRNLWGNEEKDRTTFADVAGLESVIEDMSEVVSYLSNPSLYKSIGARPPRGVLLHGPPGSGSKYITQCRCLSYCPACLPFLPL